MLLLDPYFVLDGSIMFFTSFSWVLDCSELCTARSLSYMCAQRLRGFSLPQDLEIESEVACLS